MSIEKALGKLRAAQMCHPNAVQALIDEAIAAIQQAEAQQPATGIEIDFKQTTELLTMFGGEPATVTLMSGDGHRGKGLYAYYTDLPEEGAEFLGEADDEAVPDQQPATGEPVYWEWRHLSTHPDTVDFGQWSKWQRVEARSAIHTIEDALAEFRTYIAQGYKYELRALYTHPAPSVPDDVMRDAERYRFIRDADVSDDLIPDSALYAMESLDEYIDAAMLAAKDSK